MKEYTLFLTENISSLIISLYYLSTSNSLQKTCKSMNYYRGNTNIKLIYFESIKNYSLIIIIKLIFYKKKIYL